MCVEQDGFRFHARVGDVHELYVLYSDRVKPEEVEKFSNEIVANALRKIGDAD